MTTSVAATPDWCESLGTPPVSPPFNTWQLPVRCCICGGAAFATTFFVGGTPIACCLSCDLVVGVHPPSDDAYVAVYDAEYFNKIEEFSIGKGGGKGYSNYGGAVAVNQATYRARLARLAWQLNGTGRVLDIGCAYGGSLTAARSLGWDAYELEISEHAAAVGREVYGLNVQTGTVAGARFPEGYFDAITMWHTIEHLPDPVGDLSCSPRFR